MKSFTVFLFLLKKKRTFVYLIASGASRFERFGVMSSTIESSVSVKVDQIDEQFAADAATETARMPTMGRTSP